MSRFFRRALGLGWLAAVATACSVAPYRCERNEQCDIDAGPGRCEASGFCSYADGDCMSGARYSANAALAVADQCVGAEGETVGQSGSTQGSTSSCGDGVVEGAEDCDDGNRIDGDGCSAQCTSSGSVLWSWAGPASSTLNALHADARGDIYVAGQDGAAAPQAAFVTALDAQGAQRWPTVPLAADGWQRTIAGVAAGSAVVVAGWDVAPDVGQRAWSAQIDLDGVVLGVEIDDTSADEGWRAVVPGGAGGAVLVGDRQGRGWVRWIDGPVVHWSLSPVRAPAWVGSAGRGDSAVALAWTDAQWLVLGRGGPSTAAGAVDARATVCVFVSGGALALGGERNGAPWLGRLAADGTESSTWIGEEGTTVEFATAVEEDVVVVTESGALVRVDPQGQERWRSRVDPELSVRAVAWSGAGNLLIGGVRANQAAIDAIVP